MRRLVTVVCLVLAAGLGGAVAWKFGAFGPGAPPPSAVGGPFTLTDQTGKRVDARLLEGKWSAVFFGYTFCPEACPTTLSNLRGAVDLLGPRANQLQVVFISVDPARDTPQQLKTYLSSPSFPAGVIGLTGSADEVAKAAKAYHVYYQKVGTGTDYTVDHSTALYLMDPQGRFSRVIAYGLPPDEVSKQIADAMRGH